jgi:VanZ family protein
MPKPKMLDRPGWFAKLAAAWALLIFVLSSIPGAAFPASKLFSYDKLLHAGVYAVLGAFTFMALPRRLSSRASVLVLVAAGVTTFYGFTDEFHQMFVPGRSADLRDVLADCVGGLVGALAASRAAAMKAGRGEVKADRPTVKSNNAS